MDKEDGLRIHKGILRSRENDPMMSFAATQMGLEMSVLSELSHTEKDMYHMILLICGS